MDERAAAAAARQDFQGLVGPAAAAHSPWRTGDGGTSSFLKERKGKNIEVKINRDGFDWIVLEFKHILCLLGLGLGEHFQYQFHASEVAAIFAEEDSLEFVISMSESAAHKEVSSSVSGDKPYEDLQRFQDLALEVCVKITSEENLSAYQKLIATVDKELRDPGEAASSSSG
ncbi:uncharacterized protein LOC126713454 [Quercus robur]|uniref:uncharacterized protein LOC126713454 n=1 Tax=Quercus robur TaxID=38942 RepID=UPI00216287B4|nr:uncharacterized protein LOC126713454 [Quercus robur]